MAMLIIQPSMHDLHRDLIKDSQRLGHEIFVKNLERHEFHDGHGIEVDHFDNDHAVSSIKRRWWRDRGFRMHPTTKDTLVNSVSSAVVLGAVGCSVASLHERHCAVAGIVDRKERIAYPAALLRDRNVDHAWLKIV